MNKEEILEYNKRCAEFLGWDYNKFMDRWNEDMLHQYSFVESIELKFHSDWNWIMEVVETIEKLTNQDGYRWQVLIQNNFCVIEDNNKIFDSNKIIHEKTKKESVVQTINQFLIWHEKQTTNEQR